MLGKGVPWRRQRIHEAVSILQGGGLLTRPPLPPMSTFEDEDDKDVTTLTQQLAEIAIDAQGENAKKH